MQCDSPMFWTTVVPLSILQLFDDFFSSSFLHSNRKDNNFKKFQHFQRSGHVGHGISKMTMYTICGVDDFANPKYIG